MLDRDIYPWNMHDMTFQEVIWLQIQCETDSGDPDSLIRYTLRQYVHTVLHVPYLPSVLHVLYSIYTAVLLLINSSVVGYSYCRVRRIPRPNHQGQHAIVQLLAHGAEPVRQSTFAPLYLRIVRGMVQSYWHCQSTRTMSGSLPTKSDPPKPQTRPETPRKSIPPVSSSGPAHQVDLPRTILVVPSLSPGVVQEVVPSSTGAVQCDRRYLMPLHGAPSCTANAWAETWMCRRIGRIATRCLQERYSLSAVQHLHSRMRAFGAGSWRERCGQPAPARWRGITGEGGTKGTLLRGLSDALLLCFSFCDLRVILQSCHRSLFSSSLSPSHFFSPDHLSLRALARSAMLL